MSVALVADASVMSFSVMPPTARCTNASLTVVALEPAQALGDGLERTLHVGLQHEVERGDLAGLDLAEDVLELDAASARGRRRAGWSVAAALLAGLADGAGRLLVGRGAELVAGVRHGRQTEHLHRRRLGPASLTCLPLSSIIARTRPHAPPATIGSPTFSVPLSTSTVATGPRPVSRLASSTMPLARPVGLAVSSSSSATAASCSSRSSMPRSCCADISTTIVSPPHDSGTSSCSASCDEHPLRIGVVLVDLVERHDDRHVGRLGVVDRLDRLRHDAVVGGDHQHDDVGDLGATGTHLGERGVAGGVDERDLADRRRRPCRRRCAG